MLFRVYRVLPLSNEVLEWFFMGRKRNVLKTGSIVCLCAVSGWVRTCCHNNPLISVVKTT